MNKTDNIDHLHPLAEKSVRHMRRNGMGDFLDRHPKVGIALSGGADSMALLHFALSRGWNVVALHCNFGLRGKESRRDEAFVTDHCRELGVPLRKVRFDVDRRMKQTGESVEMACRELRYEWFTRMAKELSLEAIALGHHRDDNVETFLLNMLRGSGIGGAKGIPPRRGIFIRPLLGVSRKEITEYLTALGVSHVTDSSNLSNDYNRNKARNIIIPAMEACFPGASGRMEVSISHLREDHRLLRMLVAEKRRHYTDTQGQLSVAELFAHEEEAATLLYHILDGDIDITTIDRLKNNPAASGKVLAGRSGRRYLTDRGRLIPLDSSDLEGDEAETPFTIDPQMAKEEKATCAATDSVELSARILSRDEFSPRRDPAFAWFDASILDNKPTFTLRRPKTGDRVTPFGMNGSRLLSDIFSDIKLSLVDKRRQWVVTCGEEIIWIPGVKTSNLHRVAPSTENILELHVRNIGEKS